MMHFNREFSPYYGTVTRISPLIRRLVAENPSPFTFYGTGTYIIGGQDQAGLAIIDPGPDLLSHLTALEKFLKNRVVSHILITHDHADHSPACRPLQALTGAKVYGFAVDDIQTNNPAEESRDTAFCPDHILKDGDQLQGPDWTIETVHTPGHLSNHLCFALAEEKALFTGDHIMGWSTSVIIPPDGSMKDYMASLDRLLVRNERCYYPTHGAPITEPKSYVQGLIAHRQAREVQIANLLTTQGSFTIGQMIPRLYPDLAPTLFRAAAASIWAHLIHMADKGQVVCTAPDQPVELQEWTCQS